MRARRNIANLPALRSNTPSRVPTARTVRGPTSTFVRWSAASVPFPLDNASVPLSPAVRNQVYVYAEQINAFEGDQKRVEELVAEANMPGNMANRLNRAVNTILAKRAEGKRTEDGGDKNGAQRFFMEAKDVNNALSSDLEAFLPPDKAFELIERLKSLKLRAENLPDFMQPGNPRQLTEQDRTHAVDLAQKTVAILEDVRRRSAQLANPETRDQAISESTELARLEPDQVAYCVEVATQIHQVETASLVFRPQLTEIGKSQGSLRASFPRFGLSLTDLQRCLDIAREIIALRGEMAAFIIEKMTAIAPAVENQKAQKDQAAAIESLAYSYPLILATQGTNAQADKSGDVKKGLFAALGIPLNHRNMKGDQAAALDPRREDIEAAAKKKGYPSLKLETWDEFQGTTENGRTFATIQARILELREELLGLFGPKAFLIDQLIVVAREEWNIHQRAHRILASHEDGTFAKEIDESLVRTACEALGIETSAAESAAAAEAFLVATARAVVEFSQAQMEAAVALVQQLGELKRIREKVEKNANEIRDIWDKRFGKGPMDHNRWNTGIEASLESQRTTARTKYREERRQLWAITHARRPEIILGTYLTALVAEVRDHDTPYEYARGYALAAVERLLQNPTEQFLNRPSYVAILPEFFTDMDLYDIGCKMMAWIRKKAEFKWDSIPPEQWMHLYNESPMISVNRRTRKKLMERYGMPEWAFTVLDTDNDTGEMRFGFRGFLMLGFYEVDEWTETGPDGKEVTHRQEILNGVNTLIMAPPHATSAAGKSDLDPQKIGGPKHQLMAWYDAMAGMGAAIATDLGHRTGKFSTTKSYSKGKMGFDLIVTHSYRRYSNPLVRTIMRPLSVEALKATKLEKLPNMMHMEPPEKEDFIYIDGGVTDVSRIYPDYMAVTP